MEVIFAICLNWVCSCLLKKKKKVKILKTIKYIKFKWKIGWIKLISSECDIRDFKNSLLLVIQKILKKKIILSW